jgi:3-oxoacyl-[acyl-carrier-protein] synthase II
MGALSPIGTDWEDAGDVLRNGGNGFSLNEDWTELEGLDSHICGRVDRTNEELEAGIDPSHLRSMGRVSLLSVNAVQKALDDAGFAEHPALTDGSTGVSFGSTEGSQIASFKFGDRIDRHQTVDGIKLSDYLQSMTHSCPANIVRHFGVDGRMISTSTACTSGSQGVGYGYEAIRFGKQNAMIVGGAEELVTSAAAVFNVMFEASTRHEQPFHTPRPFDTTRDGLVVSEGAGALILEEREFALERGADIYGEIIGFDCTCMSDHLTIPAADGITPVFEKSLDDADCEPDDVDYINAHATATTRGDIAESRATEQVFGADVPVSSMKGHLGHTLGACGAIESIYTVRMCREGWLAPTQNLTEVDDDCADLDYIQDSPLERDVDIAVNNNFGFGGVNTSIFFSFSS